MNEAPDSLLDRFIARYFPEQDQVENMLPDAPLDFLEQLHTRLVKSNEPLRIAALTRKDRQKLRGQTGPINTTMLAAAARGLEKCPDFARAIGVPAQALFELGEQRMAISGDIKVLEVIVQRAKNCWYAVTRAAQEDCDKVLQEYEQTVGPVASRTPTQVAIAALFERALRLHRAGLQNKKLDNQESAPQPKVSATKEEQAADRNERKRQVMQMMTDFRDGKGPQLPIRKK
jgi:hypothetical protein